MATGCVLLPRGGTARPPETHFASYHSSCRVLPLFRRPLLAFALLLFLRCHPGGLHPPPHLPSREMSCHFHVPSGMNDSHVLGPGHPSGWRGQAPLPSTCPWPHLALAPFQTLGTNPAPLAVPFPLFYSSLMAETIPPRTQAVLMSPASSIPPCQPCP